ncbi:YbfB/YjiJ family MFS transporter [Rhodobium gokarnense]|uniref:MFS family arabinose efflux permease n=1 Tax=Rhodobium gokarnense TaxID=364296 RepID=A0ABT3HI75_9HYPH|nr:YbfB/YjiJ family MFS transporter [Rhodobium gokarnense]MCW2310105.1 putative MFS family arabinose efflux permease [Rhodobium gokarnense]
MTEDRNHPLRLAIGGLIALAAAMGVGRFVYTPILPVMVSALGLSKSAAGLVASSNYAGYLLGALLAATPIIKGSRRGWFLGGLALSAVTTGLMGVTESLAAFLILRFVGGVASAFVLVYSSALVLDRLARAGRAGLASVHFAGVGLGIAGSAALMALMVVGGADWQALWWASAAVTAVALVAVAFLIPERKTAPSAPVRRDGGCNPGLSILIAAYGLYGFGYVITATFLVAIVRDAPDIAPLEPAIWLVVGLAAAPSIAIWSMVARRIGDLAAFAAACLIEALAVIVSVTVLTPPAILIAAILFGGTFMGIVALGISAGRRLSSGDAERMLALMTASFGLGQIVGPAFAGTLFDATGSFLIPSAAASAALVVAGAMAYAIKKL